MKDQREPPPPNPISSKKQHLKQHNYLKFSLKLRKEHINKQQEHTKFNQ
jgi:hypothetical protein